MLDLISLVSFDEIINLLNDHVFTKNFIINVLDVFVVWYLIYKLMTLIQGTKAIQVLKGIATILIIRVISGFIGLNTVSWLMDQVITYGMIAGIIIFQPEVRRGLEHLGRGSFIRSPKQRADDKTVMIKHLNHAIQYMSKRKIGALITIERTTGLDDYIETGIPLNANITGELLINIFIPNTPLHDGAVIIKDGKIAAASAYLPLSENESIPKEYGTRHRAAIGVSEVTDAVTIVVSEETGGVSITKSGILYSDLTEEEYINILSEDLSGVEDDSSEGLFKYFIEGFTKGVKKNEKNNLK